MKRFALRAAAVALALLGTSSAASADWIASGSVVTQPIPGSQTNDTATVYFAVYDNKNGDFVANSGLNFNQFAHSGGTSATLAADRYVYIYEVANPTVSPVLNFYVSSPGNINVALSANGYVFQSGGKSVTGTDSGSTTSTLSALSGAVAGGNFSNIGSETTSGSTSKTTDVVAVLSSNFHPNGGPPAERYDFGYTDPVFGTTPDSIAVGGFSALIIAGSNVAPVIGQVQTGDGSAAAGFAPVPAPEPGTLALLGLGLPLLGWGYARRLRASKALAAVVAQ
jgi:hypothetical protein